MYDSDDRVYDSDDRVYLLPSFVPRIPRPELLVHGVVCYNMHNRGVINCTTGCVGV